MKSDRLLSALLLLQAHGRLSTRELAERLETSQRTAHRDMEALSAAGVPVLALRGAQGGWELAQGWRTKVPGLDDAELSALLMSQPSALGHPALAAASERAFGKLLAAMPQQNADPGRLHPRAAAHRSGRVASHSGGLDLLPIVQDAIARDCKLSFLYSRADGESGVRTVDPFGIVAKQGIWYLVARAPAGMRTYRISRMQDAVVLAVTSSGRQTSTWPPTGKRRQRSCNRSASSFAPRWRLLPMQRSCSAVGAAPRRRRKCSTRLSRISGLSFMSSLRARRRRDLSLWVLARALMFSRR